MPRTLKKRKSIYEKKFTGKKQGWGEREDGGRLEAREET
jgi:hypothetical protein